MKHDHPAFQSKRIKIVGIFHHRTQRKEYPVNISLSKLGNEPFTTKYVNYEVAEPDL